MAGSLKDQLLQAGIASKKRANEIELENRRKKKQGKPALTREDQERAVAIQRARLEKIEKDRQLNQQRRQQQAQRAMQAEIRQLAEQHRLRPPNTADMRYNFVWNAKVQSLWVDADLHRQLVAGTLCLVAVEQEFALVPAAIAERIIARDPSAVVQNDDARRRMAAEEAEYADFPIPDDLHW